MIKGWTCDPISSVGVSPRASAVTFGQREVHGLSQGSHADRMWA